jgi:hypothetical protein
MLRNVVRDDYWRAILIVRRTKRNSRILQKIYSFTSRSRILHFYGDVTITNEVLQNFSICSALRAYEQGGIFIVPHLLRHGARFFRSHPNDRPIQSPLTTHKGMCKTYSNRILTGPHSAASYDTQGDVEKFLHGSSRVLQKEVSFVAHGLVCRVH